MKRILLIDDDETVRYVIKTALEDLKYEVLDVPNGELGINLCFQENFDLVITDIYMPDKDGLETIHELKNYDPTLKIIAISAGGAGIDHLEMAKNMGADRIIRKPIMIEKLLDEINQVLI